MIATGVPTTKLCPVTGVESQTSGGRLAGTETSDSRSNAAAARPPEGPPVTTRPAYSSAPRELEKVPTVLHVAPSSENDTVTIDPRRSS